jgi:acetyl-CoA carboxylase biotin carboxylase subunit
MPPYYDSLLAKIIVSGNTREEAIIRAQHSLDSFVVEGIPTTIGVLSRITRDPHFVSGDMDTGFVARFLASEKESK